MKKVMSLLLIAVLISGCNRTADNVSTAPQSLNASAPVPQSQNAPASDKSDLNPADELCGSKKKADLYCLHAGLSALANVVFLLMVEECSSHCASMFFTMLRMVSAFSFPVHAYLTNPSLLSQSKLSLTALAVDTCLSLWWLITKNPSVISHTWYAQPILELFRLVAYPHVWDILSSDFYLIKGAIWK
ncbi:hypothetical protein [Candidatus Endomicrobiellum agilis]|uniref:hypothetical protein n=1 Tax=Candidatus Endomicrobiellum agilis TaxID=3238957 RepID=UPI00357926C5|nr:hypothetical protein [Endomicrobium sp.]